MIYVADIDRLESNTIPMLQTVLHGLKTWDANSKEGVSRGGSKNNQFRLAIIETKMSASNYECGEAMFDIP